jgi:hypothetical protein
MRRWKISKFATSFMGLKSDSSSDNEPENRIEEVRSAMLDELFDAMASDAQRSMLFIKLRGATEIQTLWYLRSDLMLALSEYRGESEAMARVGVVTKLFRGMVPAQQLLSAQRRR